MFKLKKNNFFLKLLISFATCLVLVACNSEEEFFEKENFHQKIVDDGTPVNDPNEIEKIQYSNFTVGDNNSLPPLKLFFIIDNSATIVQNDIKLSNSFKEMFSGNNGENLSHFKTNILMINTAQKTERESYSKFKLLSEPIDSILLDPKNDNLVDNRKVEKQKGLIPGDLIGYSVLKNNKKIIYSPAPIYSINKEESGLYLAEPFILKEAYGDINVMTKSFNEKLGIINPNNSAIDEKTNSGILDEIVDQESGLCALSRILKEDTYINKGDLAAFILVSDENDQDEKGLNCIKSFDTVNSSMKYIDGSCLRNQTQFTYRKKIENPSKAKCRVYYNKGVVAKADYGVRKTILKYYTKDPIYDLNRTNINYLVRDGNNKYKYVSNINFFRNRVNIDKYETRVEYYLKKYSYKQPRYKIEYYNEKKGACLKRDGVQISCEPSTFTKASSKTFLGEKPEGSSCLAIAEKNIPQAALSNGKDINCVSVSDKTIYSKCEVGDLSKPGCTIGYSAINYTNYVTGDYGDSKCSTLVEELIDNSELINDNSAQSPKCSVKKTSQTQNGICENFEGKVGYKNCNSYVHPWSVKKLLTGKIESVRDCKNIINDKYSYLYPALENEAQYPFSCTLEEHSEGYKVSSSISTSDCPSSGDNNFYCRENFKKITETIMETLPVDENSCESLIKEKSSKEAYLVDKNSFSCEDATLIGRAGICDKTKDNVTNCRYIYRNKSKHLLGDHRDMSCSDFIKSKNFSLPSDGVGFEDIQESKRPVCSSYLKNDIEEMNFYYDKDEEGVNLKVLNKGDSCPESIKERLILGIDSIENISCKIESIISSNSLKYDRGQDIYCNSEVVSTLCNRNDLVCYKKLQYSKGSDYETNFSNFIVDGKLNCKSKCSDVDFCSDHSDADIVSDVLHSCTSEERDQKIIKRVNKMPEGENYCALDDEWKQDGDSYYLNEERIEYVAGSLTENSENNALSTYISNKLDEKLGTSKFLNVFVRTKNDELGKSGSLGEAYEVLANKVGGNTYSVLGKSDEYAQALKGLSIALKDRLERSFVIEGMRESNEVLGVMIKRKRTANSDIGFEVVAPDDYEHRGATVTFNENFNLNIGDELRVKFK